MNQLAKVHAELKQHNPLELTPAQRMTLEQTGIIPQGCPSHVVALFGEMCKRQKVDPFSQAMHIVPFNSYNKRSKQWEKQYTIITGIHVLEQRAESTGAYAGEDDVTYDNGKNLFQAVKHYRDTQEFPTTATATIYKMVQGQRVAYKATIAWDEFAQVSTRRESLGELTGNWRNKPFFMFAKCARATALRRAFPKQLEGLYTDDEIGAYGANVATAKDIKAVDQSREDMVAQAKEQIAECYTQSDFDNLLHQYPHYDEDRDIIQAIQDRKNEIREEFAAKAKDLVDQCTTEDELSKLYDSNPYYAKLPEVKELFQEKEIQLQDAQNQDQ